MTKPQFPELSENHRRAISTAMYLLDEMLCEVEQFAKGRELHSVFYHERNDLPPKQRERLLAEINRMRAVLSDLKDTLGLDAHVEDIAQKVWASGSAFWEVLVETETKYLRRYGETPPGLAEYLDPKMEALVQHLRKLSRIAGS